MTKRGDLKNYQCIVEYNPKVGYQQGILAYEVEGLGCVVTSFVKLKNDIVAKNGESLLATCFVPGATIIETDEEDENGNKIKKMVKEDFILPPSEEVKKQLADAKEVLEKHYK